MTNMYNVIVQCHVLNIKGLCKDLKGFQRDVAKTRRNEFGEMFISLLHNLIDTGVLSFEGGGWYFEQ